MVTAAVLCPGPSLKVTWPAQVEYDHVIAVNEAARVLDDGWWIFIDERALQQLAPMACLRLRVVAPIRTLRAVERDAVILDRLARGPGVYLSETYQAEQPYRRFSMTNAAFFAAALGATQVDVYGCDWSGSQSFDGIARGTRDEERWAVEVAVATMAFEWLQQKHGVTVRRVLPPDHVEPRSCLLALPDINQDELDRMGLRRVTIDEMELGRVRFETKRLVKPERAWESLAIAALNRARGLNPPPRARVLGYAASPVLLRT